MARGEQHRQRPVAQLLRCPRPPTAAGVGGSGCRHHGRFGNPVAALASSARHHRRHRQCAVCQQLPVRHARRRLLRRPCDRIPIPALLVAGRRRAVLPGVGTHAARHGVADPDRTPGPAPPTCGHHLAAAVYRAARAGGTRVLRTVVPGDLHHARGGVLLPAHPGLATGRRRVGGTDRPDVATTFAASRRRARLDRTRVDPAGLHLVEPGHAVSRHRGAVAHARRGAGHRGRLRRPGSGWRALAGPAADARDRPHLLLVVPVALARAGTRPLRAGSLTGIGRTDHGGPAVGWAGMADVALPGKSAAVRPKDPHVGLAQPRSGGGGDDHRGVRRAGSPTSAAHPGRAWGAGDSAELQHGTGARRVPARRLRRSGAPEHRPGCGRRRSRGRCHGCSRKPHPAACRGFRREEGALLQRLSA